MLMLLNIPQETVFGIKTAKGDKYSPDEEELDDMDDFGETLTEFIEQYLAGKLEVSKVSEWSGS